MEDNPALEDVSVVAGIFAGWLGFFHRQQLAQVGDEKLVIGALGAAGLTPAGRFA